MIKIAPSILGADFWDLSKQMAAIEDAGAEYLHLDVMDGSFVPNISFGALLIKALRPHSKMFFDAHLMIDEPARYLNDFAAAGCDLLTVHWEACRHLHRTIQEIKNLGIKASVALNPATPISFLENILPELDMVVLMSVNPGFGGQKFITPVLDKVRALKQIIDEQGLSIDIQVDGGITAANAPRVVEAGANILVAGSAVFASPNIGQAIADLRRAGNI